MDCLLHLVLQVMEGLLRPVSPIRQLSVVSDLELTLAD